ncbi:hypothetical protein TKK_0002304 [Trichogramma kaykai]|uniref:Major facilitator superfamily (MFS) profile domain-containing protein n=1 Tax=Trichogramma kaykai TaxID=54128 RepID=A0ABD2XB80_9HYME
MAEKGTYRSPEGGNRTWEYLATFACSFLMFCVGAAGGWSSPNSVKLTAPDSPLKLSQAELSTLMSLLALGQTLVPPVNFLIVDRIGRKNTMIAAGLPLCLSWLLMILFADNLWILYLTRFLAGMSQGISYCVCPMYIGEIASTSARGVANVLLIVMQNLGMLQSFVIVPLLSGSANAWINLGLVAIYLLAFSLMPDSPYYLLMRGRGDEAEAALEKLQGKLDVEDELREIQAAVREADLLKRTKTPMWKLLSTRASVKAICILALFSSTYHLCGYSAIMAYGQRIFSKLEFKFAGQELSDYTINIANGVVQLVSVLLTTLLVDRWGRKPLVAFSGGLAGACNLTIGVYFYLQEYLHLDVSSYSFIPVVAIFLTVFAFNIGLLTVQGVMISELFAPQIKAVGVCIATTNGGLLCSIGVKMYLMVAETFGYGHTVPFLGACGLVWFITALLLRLAPETKGKSLLEIQRDLVES